MDVIGPSQRDRGVHGAPRGRIVEPESPEGQSRTSQDGGPAYCGVQIPPGRTDPLDAALDYARRGWRVAPLHTPTPGAASPCSCGQDCGRNVGKHPRTRNGLSDATTDELQIRTWWKRWPTANIAILGGPGTYWGLDVDPDGAPWLAAWEAEHGALPVTRRVRTGRGYHYQWAWTPALTAWLQSTGRELKSRNGYVPGIDVKPASGYLVAPPSLHRLGHRYEVDLDVPLAEAPIALLEAILPPAPATAPRTPAPTVGRAPADADLDRRHAQAILAGVCKELAAMPAGGRNDALNRKGFKVAGLVGAGLLDEAEAYEALHAAALAAGLDGHEAGKTLHSCWAKGKAKPWHPPTRAPAPEPEPRWAADDSARERARAHLEQHPEASYGELASVAGVSPGTIKSWVHRGHLTRGATGPAAEGATLQPVAPPQGATTPGQGATSQAVAVAEGATGRAAGATTPPVAPPVAGADPVEVQPVAPSTPPVAPSGGVVAPPEVQPVAPLDRLTATLEAVRATEDAGQRLTLVAELLVDGAFLDALAEAQVSDPAAGLGTLATLKQAARGCGGIVADIRKVVASKAQQIQAARRAPVGPPPSGGGNEAGGDRPWKPEIRIGTDMQEVIDGAISALAAAKQLPLFQRGAVLVQLTRDNSPITGMKLAKDQPALRPIRPTRLRELLSIAAHWTKGKLTDSGWVWQADLPPIWATEGVIARDEWPFRRAEGITEVPLLRNDGSLWETPGFDAESGWIYEPPRRPRFAWPKRIDLDAAQAAYDALGDVVVDFPFAAEHHKSAAIAALLTLIARPVIEGPVPLFLFTATTPRSGKSLLCDVLHAIAAGRDLARMTPGTTDEELDKQITTVAISAFSAVLFDNITGAFGSPVLDAALTARTWRGRVLGRSEAVTLPLRTTFLVSGNNLELKGDIAQRSIPVHLDPQDERPELRADFRHPEIKPWIAEHRDLILTAAYTLLRAHAAAGRPKAPGRFGGFEEWNRIVRSALIWAGAPDPYAGVAELVEVADESRAQMRAFLSAWYAAFASETVWLADLPGKLDKDRYPDLVEAIRALAADRRGEINYQRLGYLFRRSKGRLYAGLRLERSDLLRHQAAGWRVVRSNVASTPPAGEDVEIPL